MVRVGVALTVRCYIAAMKIFTAHIPGQLTDETTAAIFTHWLPRRGTWKKHEIAKGDDFAYGEALAEVWAQGKRFAVVEPDIVIRDDVADAFVNCDHGYCAFPYAWTTNVGPALGCTWFSEEFIAKFPNVMREAVDHNVSYRQFDAVFMRWVLARKYRQQPHVHLPPVEHLNARQALLPGFDPTPLMEVPLF